MSICFRVDTNRFQKRLVLKYWNVQKFLDFFQEEFAKWPRILRRRGLRAYIFYDAYKILVLGGVPGK
jgi:hypothetical protein